MKFRKFRFGVLAIAWVVVWAGLHAEGSEKRSYQLKLEKGQKYYVRTVMKHKRSQTFRGEGWSGEVVISLGYNVDVNNVDANGNTSVDYTFDWIRVCEKGSMGSITDVTYDYDSSKKDSEVSAMSQIHAAYLGERFSVKMTPQAGIKKVKGLKAMHKSMVKKVGQDFTDHKIQFGEEFINEYLARPMAIYPNEPVGVGNSWSRAVKSGIFPKFMEKWIIVENTWMLQGRKDGVAIIKSNSTIKLSPEAKQQQKKMSNIRLNFSGKEQGQIEMEEPTGRVIRSEITRDVSEQTETQAGGGAWLEGPVSKSQSVVTFEMAERKNKRIK